MMLSRAREGLRLQPLRSGFRHYPLPATARPRRALEGFAFVHRAFARYPIMVAFFRVWLVTLRGKLLDSVCHHRPCGPFEAANPYDSSTINTLRLAGFRRLRYPRGPEHLTTYTYRRSGLCVL